jgi:6-phosphogluconolactonase
MMSHHCLQAVGTLAIAFSVFGVASVRAQEQKSPAKGRYWVYVGTYTGPNSKGIYQFELDLASGAMKPMGVAAETKSPSFLAIHPSRKYLYAVGEISDFDGKKSGAVSAFAIDAATGKLTPLNQQPSGGGGPCHVSVDPSGKVVLVANYGGGSIEAIPVQADGKLGTPTSFHQHTGSSVNPSRQKEPHAHSINVDPAGKYAFAADLGLDKILIYKLDPAKGTLTPNDVPYASVAPGSGPRHFAFHPSGKYAYVINEILCTVTAFKYDAGKGELTELQTISTLPGQVEEGFSTAEVVAHPSGKFLYGSNRGHNTIAVFSIDQATGKLTAVEHESTQGETPRNFAIDPTGTYLLAENQKSGTIVVFKIDPATGKLDATGHKVEVPSPVCVRFLPAPE